MKKINNILNDIYRKGFFHLFSANALIHLIEFGSQMFVAGILLADDFGRIKSLQTFAAVGVIIAGFGFNTSILKLCSEKNRSDQAKQVLFASAFKFTLLFSSLTIILGIGLSFYGYISSDSLTNNLFVYYSLTIPLIALNNLLIAYYQALKKFKKVSVLLVVARVIHVAIIIILTYLFGLNGFVAGIVTGFFISTLLLVLKTEFLKSWAKTTSDHFIENWNLAKFAFAGNIINALSLYLDVFFLNHIVNNPKEFGFYGFALTLIAGLRIITYTTQQFVTPYYSEFSSDDKQILKAFKKSNRIFGAAIIVVGLLSVLLVPILIHFLFRGKYDDSMFYFQVLTLSWAIRSWVSLKGPFLLAIGHLKETFKMSLIILLITIIPYWYLVENFQIEGALYGQVFVSMIAFIVVTIGFRQIIKKVYKN